MSADGGVHLVQRFELAAALCQGARVLDLSDAPQAARQPLEAAAAELVVPQRGEVQAGPFDAAVALHGLVPGGSSQPILDQLERLAAGGTRVLVAIERPARSARQPRVEPPPDEVARALAERLPSGLVLTQYLAEGSLIEPDRNGLDDLQFQLRGGELSSSDAAAFIVASGFQGDAVRQSAATLRAVAEPVRLSYVRRLEAAHAELLRANRELMRERLGRGGSAAASMLNQLEEMRAKVNDYEARMRLVEAWYDAPRYHAVDRMRDLLLSVPVLPRLLRPLWSSIRGRARAPELPGTPAPAAVDEVDEVTREREGRASDQEHEPEEAFSRLEQ
jgi:hypothetical protein